MTKEEIITSIKGMSVLDLADLVKALEREFGVSAAVAVAPTAGPAASTGPAAPPEEEKTEFKLVLREIGANKINVIKVVRELTALGLREAKELVESAPATVKDGVNKDDVATMRKKLEDVGAVVGVE
ncbi:MAG: 50S ribosomal protein L7/L12 [Chloroflexi bacterium]|nr:50S ribosomal protein L7/L12 [Chloroflexota bacterium]